jgi:hypothetical protein
MAEPLKHFFRVQTVERIADMIVAVSPSFPRTDFVTDASRGLTALELVPRAISMRPPLS